MNASQSRASSSVLANQGQGERTPLLESHLPKHLIHTNANDHGQTRLDVVALSNRRLAVVFGSIWIIVVLTALDSTIVATLTAVISTSFSSFNSLSWLGSSYLVATAATQPLAGRLTDLYGRRAGLLVGGTAFGIGTLLCGVASEEWIFILGRAVAGAGGGAVVAISTFVGADLVPLRKRGTIQGINNIAMGFGTGLGGLVGGLSQQLFGWKMAFIFQLPFVALGLILCFSVRDIPAQPTRKSDRKRIDYSGAATLVMSIVLLLVGLNLGGNQVQWKHPLVLVPLAASVLLFILFVHIECYVAEEPIIPLHLMLRQTVWAACVTYFFAHMAAFATLYYIPIYLQIRGNDPTKASLRFIAQSIGTAAGAYSSGLLIQITGNYTYFSLLFHVLLVSAAALATTLGWESPDWHPFLFLGLTGLGFGGMLVTTMVALISSADHSQHAVITSASFAFRAIGSSVGITLASVVFQNSLVQRLRDALEHQDDSEAVIEQVRRKFDHIHKLDTEVRSAVENGYMESLHNVFLGIFAMSIAAMLFSLMMRQNQLHTKLSRR